MMNNIHNGSFQNVVVTHNTQTDVSSDADSAVLRIVKGTMSRRTETGDKVLFSDLNISLEAGDFLAIIGPNGAGKSTLLNVFLGNEKLDSGKALRYGKPISGGAKYIGYIPQQKLFPKSMPLRAQDFVSLGVDGGSLGWSSPSHKRRIKARTTELLSEVGAENFAHQAVGQLSGGQQQRIQIAQAVGHQPKILLCDEPLLSLDSQYQKHMSHYIASYKDQGAVIAFVTHELDPVFDYATHVLYLHADGRGTYDVGSVDDIMSLYEKDQMNSLEDHLHHTEEKIQGEPRV